MKATIAVIQMDIQTGKVEANLKKAEELIEKAAQYKPDCMVLPEMWATGFAFEDLAALSYNKLNLIFDFLIKKAKETHTCIIGGTLPEKCIERLCNTAYLFGPEGEMVGKQRKINPFPLTGEDQYFNAGETSLPIPTKFGLVGIVICFDLRFPNISHKLVADGARVLCVPAQWPKARMEHWETLLKARAIENQVYVIGANRTGGRKTVYGGHSMLIDPWGQIVEEADEGETVLVGEIDFSRIEEIRSTFPLPKKNEQ